MCMPDDSDFRTCFAPVIRKVSSIIEDVRDVHIILMSVVFLFVQAIMTRVKAISAVHLLSMEGWSVLFHLAMDVADATFRACTQM